MGDGDGSSSFAFVLPAGPEWAGGLTAVTFSGPGGSFTLDGGSDDPMTILLERGTGQVRAVLRGQTQPAAAAALGPTPGWTRSSAGGFRMLRPGAREALPSTEE